MKGKAVMDRSGLIGRETKLLQAPLREQVLRRADEIIRAGRRELAAWRAGFRAGRASREDDYERGFYDGVMALKRAQHDAVALARLEHARWGPGGRKRFGRPRRGEYAGGPVAWQPGWEPGSGAPPPGWKPAERQAEEAS